MKSETSSIIHAQNAYWFNRSNGQIVFCFRHRQALELLEHVYGSSLSALCYNVMWGNYRSFYLVDYPVNLAFQ